MTLPFLEITVLIFVFNIDDCGRSVSSSPSTLLQLYNKIVLSSHSITDGELNVSKRVRHAVTLLMECSTVCVIYHSVKHPGLHAESARLVEK